MRITVPLPRKYDVVRCRLNYPHEKHAQKSHPALVLKTIEASEIQGLSVPIVVVAGGTAVFDEISEVKKRKKIFQGEIPLKEDLCLAAGLRKETKFCFSEEGVFAFPWDDECFPWDSSKPTEQGYPIYGALDKRHRSFESFQTIFLASPEFKNINQTIWGAVRLYLPPPAAAAQATV